MDSYLRQTVEEYENYIEQRGIDNQLLEAYTIASKHAYLDDDLDYAKKVSARAKELINSEIARQTNGGDFKALDTYANKNGVSFEILDYYYSVLLSEAPHLFDSYLLYLEKDRQDKDKFYKPRRTCLRRIGVIDALQSIEDDKLDLLSLSFPPSTGKAQPLYSKVLTPDGFVEMGQIKGGDKVISANGNVCKVLGVYPQGVKPIYEVTFDDGSKCRCSDEHLWKVQTRDDRKDDKTRTIMLKDMLHNIKVDNGKRKNYSIETVGDIEFTSKNFVIAPYVLGVILGDGGISGGGIIVTTTDKQVLDTMKLFMPFEYEFVKKSKNDYSLKTNTYYTKGRSEYRKALDDLGLWGKKSDDKFIPKEYLLGSYEQRLWLLRGLMDTDGFVDCRTGSCSYCSVSERLANDVVELARSLGGNAYIAKQKSGYKNKDGEYIQCKDAYIVTIRLKNNKEMFALDRKRIKCEKQKGRSNNKRFIEKVEFVGNEECQCIYIDDPSHLYITDDYIVTHNTTIEKFFTSWIIGKDLDGYSLFFSHSGDITRMYYDGILDITTNTQEYKWNEVFPQANLQGTNAKSEQINFGKYKPFSSIQCTSVGSKNAGKVRCSKYLLCDDMIGGIEEALNKNILDKLWNIYSVDARQRKTDGCKEIHIATRWSVHDIIGRLQMTFENDPRARFIAYPDINPETGESNFSYDINGFSVEFYNNQALLMDDISYRCLYKNEPIEREGLLYHDDDLRRYLTLPVNEPDAIIGVCDTKTTGSDYMVLTVFNKYEDDYYLIDCICDNSSDFGVQQNRLANIILEYNMQQCEFESNAGGSRLAKEVSDLVSQKGGRCNITTKPTETNKETRIIVNSDWVKKHCLFKDKEMYTRKSDYGEFMYWLLGYSVTGKNIHDDVPDCLANFALYCTKDSRIARVEAIHNPFKGFW